MKKSVKGSRNPFVNDSDEEVALKDDHTEKMEEGGFTMVVPESENAKRGKGSDGVNTVQGVSQEEAKEYYDKQISKMNNENDEELKYTSNKNKRAMMSTDFYKFQIKEVKKQKLEELRKGFEEDRKRLAKLMSKRQDKQKKQAIVN